MIIALLPNNTKELAQNIAIKVSQFLKNRKVTVCMEDQIAAAYGVIPLSSVSHESIDFVITMGGDGTILRQIQHYPMISAPIMAINLGGLGFMADIPLDEIDASLENLLAGLYQIQSRVAMEGQMNHSSHFAVNEIVVHRAHNPCLIELAVYVDGHYLNTFSADGIIVATPSGSTAYSLSAGGPILTPELNALVITPICPHTISNKPIVLMPKNEIVIEYLSFHQPVEITYDGFTYDMMSTHEKLIIRPSARSFRLVNMPDHDFFSTLRTKLEWKGQLK